MALPLLSPSIHLKCGHGYIAALLPQTLTIVTHEPALNRAAYSRQWTAENWFPLIMLSTIIADIEMDLAEGHPRT